MVTVQKLFIATKYRKLLRVFSPTCGRDMSQKRKKTWMQAATQFLRAITNKIKLDITYIKIPFCTHLLKNVHVNNSNNLNIINFIMFIKFS